jgi:hypothetical protein
MSPLIPYLALSLASAQVGCGPNQYQTPSAPNKVTKSSSAYGQFQSKWFFPLKKPFRLARKS